MPYQRQAGVVCNVGRKSRVYSSLEQQDFQPLCERLPMMEALEAGSLQLCNLGHALAEVTRSNVEGACLAVPA